MQHAVPSGDQPGEPGPTGQSGRARSARLTAAFARLARPRRLGIIGVVIVSMIMAILPIQLTSADPGSSLPNSPFNAGDAKLDTNPKVTFLDDPTNTQSDTSYKSGAKENQECVEPTFHKNPPHKDDFAKVWGGFASGVDGTGGFAYLAWQ